MSLKYEPASEPLHRCASFGGQFWEGYRELIPKEGGFETRAVLYELYHKASLSLSFSLSLQGYLAYKKPRPLRALL